MIIELCATNLNTRRSSARFAFARRTALRPTCGRAFQGESVVPGRTAGDRVRRRNEKDAPAERADLSHGLLLPQASPQPLLRQPDGPMQALRRRRAASLRSWK